MSTSGHRNVDAKKGLTVELALGRREVVLLYAPPLHRRLGR
jgi:hypothetical protein